MNLHDRDIKILAFKDGKKEGLAEGLAEGEKKLLEAKTETAKKMLGKNIPVEVVADCTGLPLEEVERLLEKNSGTGILQGTYTTEI